MFLYLDFETPVDSSHNLDNMSLRSYLSWVRQRIDKATVAWCVDDNDVLFEQYPFSSAFHEALETCIPVAHNTAFDLRVVTQVLDLPYPKTSHCTMELARKCWPNQVGGYSLANLTALIPGLPHKTKIDFATASLEELEAYNKNDVEGCRGLHKVELGLVGEEELRIAELSAYARHLVFNVNQERAATAQRDFINVATEAVAELVPELFGWRGGALFSVKYEALKKWLADELGFETETTSKKKLNPEKLRSNPKAAEVIDAVAEVGKALSFARRAGNLTEDKVDLGYAYYAAHTGRPSGRGEGRGGLNALNLPKHNKKIAGIIRPLFELPQGQYFVCADFANVEYRTLGLITGCKHIYKVFEDPLADPYAQFCYSATGVLPDKKNPMRQIFKQGVLSLTYLAGLTNWVHQMLVAIAKGEVTLEQVEDVCKTQFWSAPKNSDWVNRTRRATKAPESIIAVCYNTYNLFHEVHPEFKKFGTWLVDTVTAFSSSLAPQHELEVRKQYPGAPDPKWLELLHDEAKKNERSMTVRCGIWTPTVCWRNLKVRMSKRFKGGMDEPCLTVMHGIQGYRNFTPSLAVENVNQSLARNAMCALKLRMAEHYDTMFDIYDELKVVARKEEVKHCRDLLLHHAGPGSEGCGYGWAVVINPEEIEVARSFKGVEPDEAWWNDQDGKKWSVIP